jgi:hypothetical protein
MTVVFSTNLKNRRVKCSSHEKNTSQVSFRPPFYSCQGCHPEEISDTFSKRYSAWYDDDYISATGQKRVYSSNNDNNNNQGGGDANGGANDDQGGGNDDAADGGTSYYQQNDDYYNYAGTDDAAGNDAANDDANNGNHEVNTDDKINYNYKQHDDDFYSLNDDGRRGLRSLDSGGVVAMIDPGHTSTARETREVSGGRQKSKCICIGLFLSNHT